MEYNKGNVYTQQQKLSTSDAFANFQLDVICPKHQGLRSNLRAEHTTTVCLRCGIAF